ncbi:MAG: LysR substrate-binding domain-containing protein [Desulfobacterales bacterium]|nr:LysR substrate-binding domain-containing protein [Desulfobacterales bacterium]
MNVEFSIGLLRTFSAVSETGSFTRAGETLHITQSAVSMQMKRLEEAVGRPLFQKKGRAFNLTPAGETLREHALRILSAHNEAVASFSRPDLFGRLSFGCAEDYASRLLPAVLSGFREVYPRIRVDILSAPGPELLELLRRDELDLCLLEGVAAGGQVVHREPVVWATARIGAAHQVEPLPLATYAEGCAYRKWALEALRQAGKKYWVAFVSPSIAGILAAVKAGLAVAPIGRGSLDGSLRALGPEQGFPLLPVSEVSLHRAANADSELVSCFADYVAESFQQIGVAGQVIGPTH